MKRLRLGLALLCAATILGAFPALATFSIVAVDPNTQEVGSAGASCIAGSIIISDVHPGLGAIHTQSYWTAQNQNYARLLMNQGHSPQQIIDSLVVHDSGGNPTIRQYGVVDLIGGGRSAAYTGINCFDYKNHELGVTYAIAGNILLGQEILDGMELAFLTTSGTLADKLMAALQGANVPGADTRCLPNKPSISAFIRVARPGDPTNDLYLDLNVNNTSSNQNPIDLLQGLYDDWLQTAVSARVVDSPAALRLHNHPNPFDGFTTFRYELPAATHVELRVFNVLGQEVATLVDEFQPAGAHQVRWSGKHLPVAGVYLYRLTAGSISRTRRLVRFE